MAHPTPTTAQKALKTTLRKLEENTPGFRKKWMLWGTAAVAADVIRPTTNIPLVSIDLDFRSRTPSAPIQTEFAGLKRAFPKQIIREADLEFGLLRTEIKDKETGLQVSIDLMSSDEHDAQEKPETSQSFDNFPKQSLESYTRNKISCLTDRLEEKDLLHLFFLTQTSPSQKHKIETALLKIPPKILLAHQDALNKDWKEITRKCIWGELPESAKLDKLNHWLKLIHQRISNRKFQNQIRDQNRHKNKS